MLLDIIKNMKEVNLNRYKCRECGLIYNIKDWAEKCENWCKENKSCNLEITKHAIKKNKLQR